MTIPQPRDDDRDPERHYLPMTPPYVTPLELSSISTRDMLAELAVRQLEDDLAERWIEASWPVRAPGPLVRGELAAWSSRALARHLLTSHSALTSIIISPGEKFEDYNDLTEVWKMTTDAQWRARDATAGILRAATVRPLPGREFTFTTETFRGCAGEPFAGQPRGPNATGVLVGPALVLTAGHYVVGRPPESMYFFFGYFVDPEGHAPECFPESAVYRGRRIVDSRNPTTGVKGPDWALVELDRPVEKRRPLAVRRLGKIGDSRPLFVVGHPAGFPMKYALDGAVADNEPLPWFTSTLDTLVASSGSPVFDSEATEPQIEGIVSEGGEWFLVDRDDPTCVRYFRTDDVAQHGTVCTRATAFAHLIPEQR